MQRSVNSKRRSHVQQEKTSSVCDVVFLLFSTKQLFGVPKRHGHVTKYTRVALGQLVLYDELEHGVAVAA